MKHNQSAETDASGFVVMKNDKILTKPMSEADARAWAKSPLTVALYGKVTVAYKRPTF